VTPEPLGLDIAGFEYRPQRARTIERLRRKLSRVDPGSVAFVLGRAAAFLELPDGARKPAWNYAQLSRNLQRSRGVKMSPEQVRHLVKRVDPGLFEARKQANAPKLRTDPRTGAKIKAHWLLDALDRIRQGGHEPAVLAKFGYVRATRAGARPRP